MTGSLYRKILFYMTFSVFIIWIVYNPNSTLSNKDAILIIFFVLVIHSWMDKKYLYSRLFRKYNNQTELLHNIFLNCPDLIYRKDANLRYKDCNPVMKKMLNIKQNENIYNKTDCNFFSKETAETIRKYDKIVIESGRVFSYKLEKKDANGNHKVYDTLLAPITNEKKITGVIGILRDTTQVETLKEQILTQNAQLESILNNMPYRVYIKDLKGKLIFCNSKNEKNVKIPFEISIGENIAQKYYWYKTGIIEEEDNMVVKAKRTLITEKRLSHKQGEEPHWYQITKSPVFDQKENVVSILVMIKNIDKEKALAQQKETLVATITHDLKTPTNAQLSAMNYLLEEKLGTLNEQQKEYIHLAKDSNIYMRTMISTILSTFKSEQEDLILNPEPFNFYQLVHSTAKEIGNLAITKNQNIIITSKLKNEEITADALQIKRAVTNLISNAITYGFKNTNIQINILEQEDKIKIDLINKGHYISESKLSEIFEKYKTSENAKFNIASTGLGLYMSKKIIQAHNGNIYAQSFKNQTCIFGFIIPRTLTTGEQIQTLAK